MASWGSNAIQIRNRPTIAHSLNLAAIGKGRAHANGALTEWDRRRQVTIRLIPRSYWKGAVRPLLLDWIPEGIDCLVDTGASVSLFDGRIAERLRLEVTNPRVRNITLADGTTRAMLCSQENIALDVGRGLISVPVRFPVEERRAGSGAAREPVWQVYSVPQNILGMRDVLDERMLCFTPETLFVFVRA